MQTLPCSSEVDHLVINRICYDLSQLELIWEVGKSLLGRGNSLCKGPGVGRNENLESKVLEEDNTM